MILGEKVVDRLSNTTRFKEFRTWDTIDSTNRWLMEQARAGAPEGLVALTDHQSVGRGRRGRSWEAPPGTALLASILLRPVGLAPERWHLVVNAVALSARQSCWRVGGFWPGLKWPNDLLVDDRKLAGILAESDFDSGALVVGVGINVTAAPPGAISVSEAAAAAGVAAAAAGVAGPAAGVDIDRSELAAGLLDELDSWCDRWDEIADAYRAACVTLGRTVRVELADHVIEGTAENVDDLGRLLVRSVGGDMVVVSAADVVHLRPQVP